MQSIPLTAYELIETLDELFPEVVYDPEEKHDEFLLRSGERRLVRYLKARMANEITESRQGASHV